MKTYEVYTGDGKTREIKDPARVQNDLQDILSEGPSPHTREAG